MKQIFGIMAAFMAASIMFVGSMSQVNAGGSPIVVNSPSNGVFAIGQSVSVEWQTSQEFDYFTVVLEKSGKYAGNQVWNLKGDTFATLWSPRDYIMEMMEFGPGDDYRLAVCGFDGGNIQDVQMVCGYSGTFSIVNDEAPSCKVTYYEFAVIKAANSNAGWMGCDKMSVTFTGKDMASASYRVLSAISHEDPVTGEFYESHQSEVYFNLWTLQSGPGHPVVVVNTVAVPSISEPSAHLHNAKMYAEEGVLTTERFMGTPSLRQISGGETPVYLLEIQVYGKETRYN